MLHILVFGGKGDEMKDEKNGCVGVGVGVFPFSQIQCCADRNIFFQKLRAESDLAH